MADIDIPSYEQLTTLMSHLMTNYTSLALTYYRMFYDMTPQDIEIQLYDTNGNLNTYTIPNRAKDFRYCLNGEGSPEGVISAEVGSTYQDIKNGILYIKEVGNSDVTGWVEIGADKSIEKGYENPEGNITRPRGTVYEDISNSTLYIKGTDTGNTGWILVSADTSNLADKDLSNLTTVGNDKFTKKDLSNLDATGQGILNAKEDSGNKVAEINNTNIESVVYYPSVKAVTDYTSSITSNLANRDLSNLSYEASLKFDNKANISLDNLDKKGKARISSLTPYCITSGNRDSNGNLNLIEAISSTNTTYIFCEMKTEAYQISIPTLGDYEIEVVSGGARGTQWNWYYFNNETGKYGIKEGSTGAYFKGTVTLSQGIHNIILNPENGSVTIDNGFTLTGGTFSGEGNTSLANGGRLTVDTIVASTVLYNQGRSTVYHEVNQANPSDIIYGPQLADVPTALRGFGFGGSGGFYTENEAGGCYFKLVIPNVSSTEIRYNVSSEIPLKINTIDGLQRTIYGVNNDQITLNLTNGTYTKFVDETGSEFIKCKVYRDLAAPVNPSEGDVWVKLTEPLQVYKYSGGSWIPYSKIPIGTVKVTGGTIFDVSKDVIEEKLLDNGFDITVYNALSIPNIIPNWNGAIAFVQGVAGNGSYTAPADGYLFYVGVYGYGTPQTISVNNRLIAAVGGGVGIQAGSGCYILNKGDVIDYVLAGSTWNVQNLALYFVPFAGNG